VIEFDEACLSYGSRVILRDVTLTLAPGAFHFLIGPSGSGKTTFLRMCYLDLTPTTGKVRFFGRVIGPRDRDAVADLRKAIGIVHQDCQFLDHLPLSENIVMPLYASGFDPATRTADLASLLEWVDLTERVAARPPELSGGERQRAALARAVILSPDVILADEPTGNVDWDMAMRLLSLLVELNRMGKTVVIATHDLNLIRAAKSRVPIRVLRLSQGQILPAGADL
jgi:cell division transport system ATP-binding protein